MSKLQFFEMRATEMASMYDATFTKKEAQKVGVKLVTDLLESGEVDKMQFTANLARLNEVVSTAMAEIRKHIPEEKQTVLGVEFAPVNGGSTLNYMEDEIYAELKNNLLHRESLLKVASKSDIEIYDENGILVPKVSSKPRSSSITIKF